MMYIFYGITLPMVIRGPTDQASKTKANTLKMPFTAYQHPMFDRNAQIAVFRMNIVYFLNIVSAGGSYCAKGRHLISVHLLIMSRADASSVDATIKLAKASFTYRSLKLPQQRAVWLHTEHGITQTRAATEEGISRAAVQRALAAEVENREIGQLGRPRFLKPEHEAVLKRKILQRSSSLDSMSLDEIRAEVWASNITLGHLDHV